MNRNTFIFGIGGTGARVIRSLTMLLASGVKLTHTGKIIPIILDVDAENEDTNRTVKALDLYKKIRSAAYSNDSNVEGFFSANITTLSAQKAVDEGKIKDSFQLSFAGVSDTFENYLRVSDMDGIDEQFLKLLYDSSPKGEPDTELNLELSKGFKGNPNIGCIIFNELENAPEYKYFTNAIGEEDRIFIISSIFGGTGSSGFPQLLKLIKGSKNNRVRNAKIGAITVMPYFSVQEDKNSAIDSNRFISKTKAALSYYEQEMDMLDCMYYIYDKAGNTPYENKEGGKEQKNDAHIIEMISASAVLHFTNKRNETFEASTEFFEFGIKKDDPSINISHFFNQTTTSILHPLTLFAYASKIYVDFIPKKTGEAFAKELDLSNNLHSNIFYQSLSAFIRDHFFQWLLEMERNSRSFKPFNIRGDYNSMVTAKQIETSFLKKGINDSYVHEFIGKIENELQKKIPQKEKRFMLLLNGMAEKCFEKLQSLPAIA